MTDYAPYTMNGTMVTTFLSTLNTPPCFAGHCDWRIPNIKELQSIVDYEFRSQPSFVFVNAAFYNAAGCPGCTDVTLATCSCTAAGAYWSSTTLLSNNAWAVAFNDGGVYSDFKSRGFQVRAVRGGF